MGESAVTFCAQTSAFRTERNSSSPDSLGSGSLASIHGLIKPSKFKALRRDLLQLFGYVYTVAPTFSFIHKIITFVRVLQFVGPSFCAGYPNLWDPGSDAERTIRVIAVLYGIIPPTVYDICFSYIHYIYLALLAAVLLLIFGASQHFRRYAKLPKPVTWIIACYFATFGEVLHPIGINFVFYGFSVLIWKRDEVNLTETLALSLVSFALSICYFWVVMEISYQNLVFRPDSLMTAATPPQVFIFIATIVITAMLSFARYGPRLLQAIFMGICALIYFVSVMMVKYRGGFIHHYSSVLVVGGCVTSFLFLLMALLAVSTGVQFTLLAFFLDIAFWLASVVIGHIVLKKQERNTLNTLEILQEDPSKFDETVTSPNYCMNLIVIGFKYAHPLCLDWSIFKMGVAKWPHFALLWYLFAKFAAIYPEETQTLSWIFHRIVAEKVKGASIRTIKEQALSITRQREANLNTDLKSKLNALSRQVQPTKHRLRHVWDVVIQGNINEVEISTKRAIQAVQQNDADFKHLYRQYPNNRFVTRAYARFLLEVAAEHIQANDMMEKTRLLQRAIAVNGDQAQEFGMATFKLLPDRIKPKKELAGVSVSESATGAFPDVQDGDEEVQFDVEQLAGLKHRIEELTIPAVVGTIITHVVLVCLFFMFPVIFGLLYIDSWIGTQQEPIAYLAQLALLRTYVYQIPAFTMRYIGENLTVFGYQNTYPASEAPESLGGEWETRVQIQYIISQSTLVIQQTTEFRGFGTNSEQMTRINELLFGSSIPYKHAYSPDNYTTKNISLQAAMMDFVVQLNPVVMDPSDVPPELVNTSSVLNLVLNCDDMADTITEAADYLYDVITTEDDTTNGILTAGMAALLSVTALFFVFCLVADIYWLKRNKRETYRCMAALPKNTVSALAENLRIVKKETEDHSSTNISTDLHKQEENILKVFNTGTSSDAQLSDVLLLIVTTITILGLIIASDALLARLVTYETMTMSTNAPHVDSLLGSYAEMMGAMLWFDQLLLKDTPYRIYATDDYRGKISKNFAKAREYVHLTSFGGEGEDQLPFIGLTKGLENAKATVNCSTEVTLPETFLDAFHCFSPDAMFMAIEPLLMSHIDLYDKGMMPSLNPREPLYDAIWHILIHPLYDGFFKPVSDSFLETVSDELQLRKNTIYPPIIAMIVVVFILEIITIVHILSIDTHIRQVLKLLLHCPPDVVLSTPKILKVLSGNFVSRESDSMDRHGEFFNLTFAKLPEAVMYADTDLNVEAANEACSRIFPNQEIVGENLVTLFSSFVGDTKALFGASGTKKEMLTLKREDGDDVHLEVTVNHTSGKIVATLKDVTQIVRYNTLIREERTKADQILSTILPSSIVRRFQEGEKNISFAVQSASIVFIDVADFNTWAVSVPPATVMSTLTALFARFDSLISNKPTMTKIKSIGDCYMAAGGIFSEVNQPAEHAKEAVGFGLEAIRTTIEFGKEQSEKVRIRVGANTGGPIVAGVLTVAKPTFEIVGAPINLAQEMGSHGIPMAVHITRSVYELIYGDTFTIRERGTVEVKGGTVITYIVTQKN